MASGNRPTQELRIPCEGTYTYQQMSPTGEIVITRWRIDCPDLSAGQSVLFQGKSLVPEVHFWCLAHLKTVPKVPDVKDGWMDTCTFEELEE